MSSASRGGHDGELLADEDAGEQVVGSGEDHGLLLEVFDMGTLSQEFGHIAHLVTGLLGEPIAGAGEDGGAHEDGHIGELADKLRHEGEVLRAVVLGGDVDLQESDVDFAQIIIISKWSKKCHFILTGIARN